MQLNVGIIDRAVRAVIGVALITGGLYAGLSLGIWPGYILAVVGLYPLATGLLAYCPLYEALKINTNKRAEKPDKSSSKKQPQKASHKTASKPSRKSSKKAVGR